MDTPGPVGSFSLRMAMTTALALCWSVLALGGDAIAAPRAHPSVGFEPGPLSVATDPAGNVYLSDPQANGQIQKFTPDGTLLARWGHFGWNPGNYLDSRAIATDAAGNVYVAMRVSGVRVFTSDGSFIRQWSAATRAIATDPAGYVYVIGGGRSERVEKFTADGSLVTKWGGGGGPHFSEPWGIATGASGNVYVADTYGNKIQVFTADGSFVTAWGDYGHGAGQLVFPYGVATDPAGNVYVADTANNRVQKFSASGKFIGILGSAGRGPGHFDIPTSVATDSAGNVYVADAGEPYPAGSGARVQKFTPDGKFVTQWGNAPALPRPARPRVFATLGAKTARRSAVFRFRSRQRDVGFQCRLTGKRVPGKLRFWRSCVSPRRYVGLRPGRKVFLVRVVKDLEAGKVASRSWRIVKRGRRSR